MARTLASQIVRLEQADFVGRRRELLVADSLFADRADENVLLVHGPGGIGKSVLLREIRRRGREAGWTPFALEDPHARRAERPLVLIDDYDPARGAEVRAALATLPARAVVVVAGRDEPEPGWFQDGWETVVIELPLTPFSAQEARLLLDRLGVGDDARGSAIVAWARGLPLSLRLGATAARADSDWMPGHGSAALGAHVRRVAEVAWAGPFREVFALAAVARTVTHQLVAEVLPEVDPVAAVRWLGSCGIFLDDSLRRRLRAELRERDPELERDLRARVADSLHARGDLSLTIDLADLVENPAVRSGYSWDGGLEYHVGGPGPGDEALAEDPATRAFFVAEPDHVLVARDGAGVPAGYSVAYASGTATELALADPRLGRWLRHAPPESIVWRDSVNLTRDPRARVQALLNMSAILGSGLRNPRYAYLPIDPSSRAALAFSAAVGARHEPSLDHGGIECHIIDYGPGGLLGALRDHVHRELGLEHPAIDPEAVRDALRNLHLPGPLAVPRERLEEAAERAFGDTPDEHLLRQVLLRGYFDPSSSHEAAARELHLSRAAYFRRLRSASERVAAFMGSSSTM